MKSTTNGAIGRRQEAITADAAAAKPVGDRCRPQNDSFPRGTFTEGTLGLPFQIANVRRRAEPAAENAGRGRRPAWLAPTYIPQGRYSLSQTCGARCSCSPSMAFGAWRHLRLRLSDDQAACPIRETSCRAIKGSRADGCLEGCRRASSRQLLTCLQ